MMFFDKILEEPDSKRFFYLFVMTVLDVFLMDPIRNFFRSGLRKKVRSGLRKKVRSGSRKIPGSETLVTTCLHVARIWKDSFAVGIGVPGLFVDLEGTLGGHHLYPTRHLREVINSANIHPGQYCGSKNVEFGSEYWIFAHVGSGSNVTHVTYLFWGEKKFKYGSFSLQMKARIFNKLFLTKRN